MPGKNEIIFCSPFPNEEIGIYAPQMKPYPALMIVPTAEICPCVDKKKLIIEDNAVPNKTSSKISRNKKNISASNIFQPTIAT